MSAVPRKRTPKVAPPTEPANDSDASEAPRPTLPLAVPILAGLVFCVCGLLAAGTMQHTLRRFAEESGGVRPAVFVAVPALFAALYAVLAYQTARREVTKMANSLSRALLVALLTWISFSALATWAWCLPDRYGECYRSFLIVSGLIGGGPMLIAAGVAGGIMGWLILRYR